MESITEIYCPWCEKGETLVEGKGTAKITVRCSKCKHCYRINLQTRTVTKVPSRVRQGGNSNC